MPRPKRCRRICGFPDYWSFVPEDSVVNDYLADKLDYDPEAECHHHDHEHGGGHNCHHGAPGSHGCH